MLSGATENDDAETREDEDEEGKWRVVLMDENKSIGSPWMTVNEAALYARCSKSSILDARTRGDLIGHKRGGSGRFLFHRFDLDIWIRCQDLDLEDSMRAARVLEALGHTREASAVNAMVQELSKLLKGKRS